MASIDRLHRLAQWPLASDRRAFAFTLASTLAVELALAERRFRIFSNDILMARKLDTGLEWGLFVSTLVVAQAALLLLSFLAIRLLRRPGRRRGRPMRYDFIFWSSLALMGAATARYRVLALLGDEAGIQAIRNLGGGSLVNAAVYALEEAAPMLAALAVAVLAYLLLRRAFPTGDEGLQDREARPQARRLASCLALGAALPFLLLAAARADDTRLVLERFAAPYSLYFLFSQATDFDHDGYSYFSAHTDVAPFDAARHPFALDVPGNAIDEDGFGGDAQPAPHPSDASPAFGDRRRHVVLIVLESVRADALTMRWGRRRIAPNLVRLASEGSYSTDVYSHSGFTAGTLKALFSGRVAAAGRPPSIFRDFRRGGYRVGTFSAQVANFGGVADAAEMRRNSDVFVDAKTLEDERLFDFLRDSTLLVDGRALLREFDRSFGHPSAWTRPTFIYFNFQAAHYPYNFPGALHFLPGEPIPRSLISAANADWVRRTYWDSVAYSDWLVGRVIARLRALGIFDDTVLIVVGDHGEQLFENGFLGHGQVINQVQTQVPLVISQAGVAIPRPAGHADLRALILRLAGARLDSPQSTGVFQYVGDLDTPSSIALVQAGGRRTTLNLETEEVSGHLAPAPVSYRQLDPASSLGRAAQQLVQAWERERWTQHIDAEARR